MGFAADDVVIAVDIGGGSVKLALANAAAEELATANIDRVPEFRRDALLAAIGQRAVELRELGITRGGRLAGVAIGVPGHVAPGRSGSLNSNVPELDGVDLVGHFAPQLGCRIEIENDANLAALGEWAFGPHRSAARFMMLTLGTGIGVALLDNGAPVGVVGGTLGDAGHVAVDPAGSRSCRLGCKGCLESVASGVALIEMAEELAGEMPDSGLAAVRSIGEITAADLARMAAAGDGAVLSLLGRIGRWLGMAIASFSNIFAPDVIAIGGGMSRFRPYLEREMLAAVADGAIKNRDDTGTIYFSGEYDRSAARGAVALFFPKTERADG